MQNTIQLYDVILSERCEVDISQSVPVPEYLPGCIKVLRCECVPVVTNSELSGNELSVEGYAKGYVLYLSDYNDKIKCLDFSKAFSKSFKLKQAADAELVPEIICSAVCHECKGKINSPRSIEASCKIVLSCKICAERQKQIAGEGEENICTKAESYSVFSQKYIQPISDTVSFDYELAGGEATIGEILLTKANAAIDSVIMSEGTLSFNGSMDVMCFYEVAVGNDADSAPVYNTVTLKIPFEGVVNDSDITPESVAVLYANAFSPKASISYDSYGENRIISFAIQYTVQGYVYNERQAAICKDAFCTQHPYTNKMCTLSITQVSGDVSTEYSFNQSISSDLSKVAEIHEVFPSVRVTGFESLEQKCFANARVSVLLICDNVDSQTEVNEIGFDVKVPMDSDGESSFDIYAKVSDIKLSRQGAKVDCSGIIKLYGVQKSNQKVAAVEEVLVDDSINKDTAGAKIVMYYPEENESVWDISKQYGVQPDSLKSVNGIEGEDVGKARVIIIP